MGDTSKKPKLIPGASSPGIKDRMKSVIGKLGLQGSAETKVLEELSQFLPGTPSTQFGSPGGSSMASGSSQSQSPKQQGGKNTNNQNKKWAFSKGSLQEQVTAMKNILLLVMRAVCAQAQEFRRLNRENQLILAFEHTSTVPARFKEAKEAWKSEIPEPTEETPFPLHKEYPWRVRAFLTVAEESRRILGDNDLGLEDEELDKVKKALETLMCSSNVQSGIQRFWRLSEIEFDDDGEIGEYRKEELGVLRLSHGPIRADRGPKGSHQEAMENILENELPRREKA